MSYSHLTITDRIKIETYLELGLKPCRMASKLRCKMKCNKRFGTQTVSIEESSIVVIINMKVRRSVRHLM